MKKALLGIIIGVIIGGGGTWLLVRERKAADAAAAAPAAPDESPLHFTADQRKKSGIVLGKPTEMEVKPQFHAFGKVLDPTPLVSLFAELTTAKAQLAAAQKEFTRVKMLNENGGNASTQAVEAADAAVAVAKAQMGSARARLVAGWGKTLADKAEQGWLQELFDKGWELARIDFLPGESPESLPAKVQVSLLTDKSQTYEAEPVGPASTVDPQVQGMGFLVVLHDNSLPAGTSLESNITSDKPGEKMLTVPGDSVVYHQGSPWVYALGYKDTFERHLIELGAAVPGGYAVKSGVAADDQLVVAGAQQLLSNELQAGAEAD